MCPCQVCTEARDATKNAKKKSPKAKTRPGKKGTKARKGCVSGSANVPVCGYIYIYENFQVPQTAAGSSEKVCLSLPLKKHSSSWLKLRWLETFGAFSKRAIHKELVQVTASQKNLMSQPTSGVPGFARSKKLISGSLGW